MNKIEISIPKGILFLGNYSQLTSKLPHGKYILNKVMTGCGATTMFLADSVWTVLCSPRRELIYCKANSKMFKGKVHLFGYNGDVPIDDVMTKINSMKQYIGSVLPSPFSNAVMPPKILVTYDSLKHVIQGLNEMGLLDKFRFVVDEFQTIFTDAAFRGDIEAEFMENLQYAPTVVYLSATPYLIDYLDQLDEFNQLPYVELNWPPESTHKTYITPEPYYNGSPSRTIDRIINKFKHDGYFEEVMDSNGVLHRSTQAVFFVNEVKFIISTIKKNKLLPSEVNVICANNNDNDKKLNKIGICVGHAPKEGEPHCTYTFCTKAAFEGVDFYSPDAFTYIFSNANIERLAVDISLDLAQIMGRQRLPSNVFRYSAKFYYTTLIRYTEADKKAFFDKIMAKVEETNDAIQDYEASNSRKKRRDARKYRNSQEKEKYENDYITVVDDKVTKEPKFVFNKYVWVNELRAWQVQSEQYLNGTLVMASVNNTFGLNQTTSNNLVNVFLQSFVGSFENKMRMYAEFLTAHPECKDELQRRIEIPSEIKGYFNALGIDRLRALSWKEASIKSFLASQAQTSSIVKTIVVATFTKDWYSLSETKLLLQGIYNQLNLKKQATATDLEEYIECEEKKRTSAVSGKRERGYQLLHNKTTQTKQV